MSSIDPELEFLEAQIRAACPAARPDRELRSRILNTVVRRDRRRRVLYQVSSFAAVVLALACLCIDLPKPARTVAAPVSNQVGSEWQLVDEYFSARSRKSQALSVTF